MSNPETCVPRGRTGRFALVTLACLAGTAVRVAVAVRSEVWLDEANSVLIALTPWPEMAGRLALDSSPPLYYLLLRGWIAAFGVSTLALRVPSLIAGCLAIPSIYVVGRKLDRPATGLVAAWLLALNPLHILYSEEIRMYALLFLLALWFNDAAFRLLPRGRLLPAALLGSALAWTHSYGLVYAGVALGLVWMMEPAARRRAATCVAWIVAAFLPCLGVFIAQLGSPHHVEWIVHFWRWYPGGFGILRSLQAFLPGGTKPSFLPLQGLPFQPLVLLFALLPVAWWLYRRREPVPRAALTLPLATGIATLALLVVYSYATWPVYIAGRSDIVTLPAFLVPYAALVARGGGRFAPAHVAGLALVGLLELGGSATALRKEGNAAIAAAIAGQDCRVVITSGLAYASVRYQGLAGGHGAEVRPYPLDMGQHPGNFDLADYPVERLRADAMELSRRHAAQAGLCLLMSTLPYAEPLFNAFLLRPGTRYAAVEDLSSSLLPGDSFILVHAITAPPSPSGRNHDGD